ncbi:MAG: hypothetical protein E4H10_01340 [Bacteroidia bacterium]|nr:MAG: hypothetical protein E4H10_01340 [Bacteroidia bacterium]
MRLNAPAALTTVALVSLLFCVPVWGQQLSADYQPGYPELVDRAYGQDQELVNGMQYYNHHPRSLGNPYLLEGFVHQGSVSIRGVIYNNVWLKYDIYAQQVEVEYRTLNGADNQVVLVGVRVDEFRIGEHLFRNLSFNGEPELFYQVIGSGRMICYISWEKKLIPRVSDSRFTEEYTAPKRKYLLELDGEISEFLSKKDFVKLFPEDNRKKMKKLVRQNSMQFRIASPAQLNLFLIAASNLLNEDQQR